MKTGLKYWLFIRLPFGFIFCSIALVMLLKWVPVRYTPVMLKRAFQFRSEENYRSCQEWVSLENISPELIKAVILAEDQNFYSHHGFDWDELGRMWKAHRQEGTPLRGCSTISQQTAKNVFTFGSETWFRKGLETWWTFLIEHIWGKNRILEVYLNVAEMGKGLFGAGIASREYFELDASELDLRHAIALAVCLPHPLKSTPIVPLPIDRRRRVQLLKDVLIQNGGV